MCCTGTCSYELYDGECGRINSNIRKGLSANSFPEDAACTIAEREIEKLDKAIHETKEEDLLQDR